MATIKERDEFVFGALSEIPLEPKTEDQITKSLFKTFQPDKIIDEYERQLGITKSDGPLPNLRYKHVMLSPGLDERDSELLNQLMNDPELYQVVNRSQNWTPRGELKIFIEYTENLDIRKARDEKKAKETTPK